MNIRENLFHMFPGPVMYIGMIMLASTNGIWICALGHSIEPLSFIKTLLVSAFLFVVAFGMGLTLRNQKDGQYVHRSPFLDAYRVRILCFVEGIFFISMGWMVLRLFNHLNMTTLFPYADELLASMDQMLFMDWNSYFEFVATRPVLIFILENAYTGLTHLSMVGFAGLILTNRLKQARFFIVAFVLTAAFSTVSGMFFPARGTVAHLLENTALIANFPYSPGTYFVEIIEHLRSGAPVVFDFNYLPGLTTFPSFHTAAGIVLAYAYRANPLFWPVLIYVVVMIAATPIYGGHYFVDLIAGAIVALVVCRLVEHSPSFRGTFEKENMAAAKDDKPGFVPAE